MKTNYPAGYKIPIRSASLSAKHKSNISPLSVAARIIDAMLAEAVVSDDLAEALKMIID